MLAITDLLRPLLVSLLLVISATVEAGNSQIEPSRGGTDSQPQLLVVASIQPLALMVRDVAGEYVDVDVLLKAGQIPHDFAFKVSDRQRLAEADVLFWVGPGLEPYLKGIAAHQSSLSMAQLIPDHATTSHAEGSQSAHHHADQHLWLNPEHGEVMLQAIAEKLALLDPPHADIYRKRAQQQVAQLAQLHAKTGPSRPYAVVHDAYNHLLEYFQYPQPLVLTPTPDVSPGARQLWQVSQSLAAGNCVLIESGRPKKWVNSFTERNGLVEVEVDIMGVSGSVGTYFELVQGLVSVFDQCAIER